MKGSLTLTNLRVVWVSENDSNDNISAPWIQLKRVHVNRNVEGECLALQTADEVNYEFKIDEADVNELCAFAVERWKAALANPMFGVDCAQVVPEGPGDDPLEEFEAEMLNRFERAAVHLGSGHGSNSGPLQQRSSVYEVPFNQKEQHFGKMPQD